MPRQGRLILVTLLMVLSCEPVSAEWVLFDENTRTGQTVYADPDSLRRKGNVMKLWELYDFKTTQTVAGDPFSSVKMQVEYDCAEELSRIVAFSYFSDNMGHGTVVLSGSPPERKWAPVSTGRMGLAMWKAVCVKE